MFVVRVFKCGNFQIYQPEWTRRCLLRSSQRRMPGVLLTADRTVYVLFVMILVYVCNFADRRVCRCLWRRRGLQVAYFIRGWSRMVDEIFLSMPIDNRVFKIRTRVGASPIVYTFLRKGVKEMTTYSLAWIHHSIEFEILKIYFTIGSILFSKIEYESKGFSLQDHFIDVFIQ